EYLSKLEPTDAVRALAKARLEAEKVAEVRALLEPIAAGEDEPAAALPEGYAVIVEDRARVAERRAELVAELEAQPRHTQVEVLLKERIAADPSVAVVYMERLSQALSREAPSVNGLAWERVLWPPTRRASTC